MKKRQRTEKSRYKHESTGEYCTCAAYVAEQLCRKNAENKNQGSLPYKFWNKKPWNWTFKRQIFLANKLLKKYSEEALVRAILSDDFKRIFSLNHPSAEGIVSKYDKIISQQKQSNQTIEVVKDAKFRTKKFGKRNSLSKLKEIENGKKEKQKGGDRQSDC